MLDKNYSVLGIGAPLLDYVFPVSEEFIQKISGDKGGMELVSFDQFNQIVQDTGQQSDPIPAGCTANIIKGLAQMGHPCKFLGKAGQDCLSIDFKKYFEKIGVTTELIPSRSPTARAACLVTPDGQRTIRTFIGAAGRIQSKHVTEDIFKDTRHVHIEGYAIHYGDLMDKVLDLSKKNNLTISMDLGSFETVRHFRDHFQEIIKKGIDILFANETEAEALVQKKPKEACCSLAESCRTVVITEGAHGYWVKNKELKDPVHGDVIPIEKLVDTTGAGDSFACGFLYGFLEHLSVLECARKGAIAASKIIQIQGTNLSPETWLQIKES